MSLNLDFKVQKEQKVREIEDSLQNYLPKQNGIPENYYGSYGI